MFSLVRGKILATRVDEVVATYQAALAEGPPPGIAKTYLLSDGTGGGSSPEAGSLSSLCAHHRGTLRASAYN